MMGTVTNTPSEMLRASRTFEDRPKLEDKLLWLDLETTGSDEANDCIIEVGCVLTTHDLIELASSRPS